WSLPQTIRQCARVGEGLVKMHRRNVHAATLQQPKKFSAQRSRQARITPRQRRQRRGQQVQDYFFEPVKDSITAKDKPEQSPCCHSSCLLHSNAHTSTRRLWWIEVAGQKTVNLRARFPGLLRINAVEGVAARRVFVNLVLKLF